MIMNHMVARSAMPLEDESSPLTEPRPIRKPDAESKVDGPSSIENLVHKLELKRMMDLGPVAQTAAEHDAVDAEFFTTVAAAAAAANEGTRHRDKAGEKLGGFADGDLDFQPSTSTGPVALQSSFAPFLAATRLQKDDIQTGSSTLISVLFKTTSSATGKGARGLPLAEITPAVELCQVVASVAGEVPLLKDILEGVFVRRVSMGLVDEGEGGASATGEPTSACPGLEVILALTTIRASPGSRQSSRQSASESFVDIELSRGLPTNSFQTLPVTAPPAGLKPDMVGGNMVVTRGLPARRRHSFDIRLSTKETQQTVSYQIAAPTAPVPTRQIHPASHSRRSPRASSRATSSPSWRARACRMIWECCALLAETRVVASPLLAIPVGEESRWDAETGILTLAIVRNKNIVDVVLRSVLGEASHPPHQGTRCLHFVVARRS
ncbi:hypothetical protein B0H63DRAFT_449216 [Podospora didyma]|uniref:Uncharacterized protein n=1 Tax=Podospora didyma TaxID=330526 RepID=A0AAE0TZJ4_9PEZI|nr:hypothetical protein B0H63DRAFT_449216 [Podospora didyma]